MKRRLIAALLLIGASGCEKADQEEEINPVFELGARPGEEITSETVEEAATEGREILD